MIELRTGWWGTDLGPYRPCDGTYCFFDSASLPTLPPLDGTFGWLSAGGGPAFAKVEQRTGPVTMPIDPGLPSSYQTFMSRPELPAAIPSCTACYWSTDPEPVPSPLGDGGRLLRFLSDQQDVLFWYLWLRNDGGHRVVCGSYPYHETTVPAEHAARDLVEVATEFEEFAYRFWVENLAWFELEESDGELSPPVRAYLAGYQAS